MLICTTVRTGNTICTPQKLQDRMACQSENDAGQLDVQIVRPWPTFIQSDCLFNQNYTGTLDVEALQDIRRFGEFLHANAAVS